MNSILEELKKCILNVRNKNDIVIERDTLIKEELDIISAPQLFDLCYEIETIIGITIKPVYLLELNTVGELVDLIEEEVV